jgi:hypothetical protein
VRFSNNVVEAYADPFEIAWGVSGLTIANNLVIDPRLAFTLPSLQGPAFVFDYNVFGAAAALPGAVGEKRVDAAAWMATQMPHSRVVAGVALEGGDLSRILGFSPVDAGRPLGSAFKGSAPDIGVADR